MFVAGRSSRSTSTVTELQTLCAERLGDAYELEVIDVIERPQAAEDDKVIATPTLIRVAPGPPRRVLGDLSDARRVLSALGLRIAGAEHDV